MINHPKLQFTEQAIESWALSRVSHCIVAAPSSVDECADLIEVANKKGLTIAPRGNGCSFADANQNTGHIIADMTGMNQIHDWNPETGLMRVGPGVSYADMILRAFPDGWAVPCVPGGQHITVGGAISFNVHGKDGFKNGNFGSHVRSLKLLTPQRELLTTSPEDRPQIFQACVAGMGLLGFIVEAEIQMIKITSPMVDGDLTFTKSVTHSLELLDNADEHDFAIAWVDAISPKPRLGRGYVAVSDWSRDNTELDMDRLRRSLEEHDRIFGIVPKKLGWSLLAPFWQPASMGWINAFYIRAMQLNALRLGSTKGTQLFTEQVFMHNSVPDINSVYRGHGVVEIQALLPRSGGHDGVVELMELCNKLGAQSLMCGIKRHLPDDMMLSFSDDGYTFGIDLNLRGRDRGELIHTMRQLYEAIATADGKVHLAKDEMLPRDIFERMYPRYKEFMSIKDELDPERLMVTDMARRLLL